MGENMRHAVFPTVAIAAVMVAGVTCSAQADDRETCKTASGDAAIEACTRAIESKKFDGAKHKRVLSLLYTNRGVEYEIKKDYDRALADHERAIKVDPKNPAAYMNRGNTYLAKQDYERAVADFDQAIKLNPKYAEAFFNRGIAKRNHGDAAGGEADIAQAKALQPGIGATQ
jgi:tetratricopeptide (TPR) repeat protein